MQKGAHPFATSSGTPMRIAAGTGVTGEVRSVQGFAVYVLANKRIELAVVPALGARVISLKDIQTGREWMWHPGDSLNLFSNNLHDDFSKSPLAGLDECLPTIAACHWEGRDLPDHGEAWSTPWQVDEDAWVNGKLTTRIKLAVSPFEWERTIEVHGNEIQFSYQLKNLAATEERYLWAMHPLLRLTEDDQLELPPATRDLISSGNWNGRVLSATANSPSIKAFARPIREGFAAVKNDKTGDRLEFRWDARINNTLGLWLTRGGWHEHHHFALEPANAADDSLAAASKRNESGRVPGHGAIAWNVRLRVGI
jgi:hypothetical protein